MKKILVISVFITASQFATAQEGFGTSNPAPSSVVDMTAATKGVLLPRVALTSTIVAAPISAPANALTVFNTATAGDVTPGYYYWSTADTKWIRIIDKEADLRLIGNNNHITKDAGNGSNGTSVGMGMDNIAIGPGNLQANLFGGANVAIGRNSMYTNQAGINNLAIGSFSLYDNVVGDGNISLGHFSLTNNTTGSFNSSFGVQVMSNNTTGSNNTAGGLYALADNISGNYNVVFGVNSLRNNTTGNENIAIGHYAGSNLTAGNSNIFIGANTPPNISTTSSNQLNIGNWIYGNNGNIGVGAAAINPSARFDVGNGNIRVRDINSAAGTGTDKAVVADANGVLKTVAQSSLAIEPWQIQSTTNKATANTDNIYQTGSVAIGKNVATAGVSLDVSGAVRTGAGHSGTIGANSAAFGNANIVSANEGVAAGTNLTVTGNHSLASGNSNTVAGDDSFVTGGSNIINASADHSFTAGQFNILNSDNTYAIGQSNTLNANNSLALGNNLTTGSFAEIALGRSNAITTGNTTTWILTDPLLQLGNSGGATSNALTILKNGNIGTGIALAPTERLDIGSGNVRVRDINTALGLATDKVIVADATGILKSVTQASVAIEPWLKQSDATKATANTDNIYQMGNVGINTNNMLGTADASVKLAVNGSILTANSRYADYVFEDYFEGSSALNANYSFKSLSEIEKFISINRHLPGVTNIQDLAKNENGDYLFDISKLSVQVLEKVEELYLHTIEQQKLLETKDKEILELKNTTQQMNERLDRLEQLLIEKK